MSGLEMSHQPAVDTIYLANRRPTGKTIDVLVFYVSADGHHRWRDFTMECPLVWTGVDLEKSILDHCPDFVKESWFRIEACTHSFYQYGGHAGGEAVFCAKRGHH